MKPQITEEEYNKAYEIVRKYQSQFLPKENYVTITYKAFVTENTRVPINYTIDQIKEELNGGVPYYLGKESESYIEYDEICRLIVDGDEISL